ncbi:MAG: LPS export ABC transporter periplasmic protein LptC [Muribaculaceae bacterium]|nr:LPS export ABC transporter periplasmic protein LptC [Muribaculaceae bacterium]
MNHPLRSMRLAPLAAIAAMLAAASCGSGGGKPATEELDRTGMPTMVTRDVETYISDSGITRYHISTVLWKVFDEAEEPYWKFPDGLFLEKFDDNLQRDATVESDSATYFSNKRLWRLDGNVRMVNTAGDLFLTNQIFWDQIKHEVYSDSFIHIERSDRTIEGYGFESNDQMTAYTVRNPSGIFPANRFRGGEEPDTTAAEADNNALEPVRVQPDAKTPRTPERDPAVNAPRPGSQFQLHTKAVTDIEK